MGKHRKWLSLHTQKNHMNTEELFSTAIGVKSPWFVKNISFEKEKGELNIEIDFAKGSEFQYANPQTGEIKDYKAYDTTIKRWRHMNFFEYRCYLNARVPRVQLEDGTVKQVKTPWEGISNGFTLLFEAFILQLVKILPVHQICQMIGSYDNKIWDILHCYTDSCLELSDYSQVKEIGVDETAARRGHDYVTLFVDLAERKTIFVTEGKDNKTVVEFVKDLTAHQGEPEKITAVTCDMSPAFIKGVAENLPNAEIVFDKFHILKIINEAVDKVRKEEVKSNPILKDTKFVFLKNQSNFTLKQKEKYEQIKISKLNIKTFKAMQIRESFQQIYLCETKELFVPLLKKWYWWATHSKIQQMVVVAKTIKDHWNGIVSWANKRINNGILEGFNSIFQAAKAKARGYKKTKTIKSVIYILTARLDFSLINPFCATHTLL